MFSFQTFKDILLKDFLFIDTELIRIGNQTEAISWIPYCFMTIYCFPIKFEININTKTQGFAWNKMFYLWNNKYSLRFTPLCLLSKKIKIMKICVNVNRTKQNPLNLHLSDTEAVFFISNRSKFWQYLSLTSPQYKSARHFWRII